MIRRLRKISRATTSASLVGAVAVALLVGAAPPSYADENSNGHNVGGAILQEWIAVGRNGFAVTDELNANYGGKWQAFSNHNSIYYHRDTGAHQVGGLIRDRWEQLGWENSGLHFPTSRELDARKPGRFNRFQGGNIYWKSGASAAYNVQGEILKKWGQLDYENGALGFPTSNEVKLTRYGGAVSSFERGAIYWSPNTGTHVVWGQVLQAWASRNYENGRFGYPTSDEFDFMGGKAQNFEFATIDWKPGDPSPPPADLNPQVAPAIADYSATNPPVDARQQQSVPEESVQPSDASSPADELEPAPVEETTSPESSPSSDTTSESTSVQTTPSPNSEADPSLEPQRIPTGFNFMGNRSLPARTQEEEDQGNPLRNCGIRADFKGNPHPSQTRRNGQLAYPGQIHTTAASNCSYFPTASRHSVEGGTGVYRWWFNRGVGLPQIPGGAANKVITRGGLQVRIDSNKARIVLTSAVGCTPGTKFRYYSEFIGTYQYPQDREAQQKTVGVQNGRGEEQLCLGN
ncbi:LGFP repeat-containing protein [Rhodococcoides fascians]|uniref:LGFP repeat-containing protein n=1 Tax=Rhodococcoides fascians TaxID=1828 RepID=UPI00068F9C84|nr:hypothetical protein [Rhodococcus fascians]